MAWNGSGTFSRAISGLTSGPTAWAAIKALARKIRTDDHDSHDQDIATGINATLTKNGENSPTANLPMATFRHTGAGAAAARTDYAQAAQVQDGGLTWAGNAGGTADAITLTLTPAITAYAAGMAIRFRATATNTGTATINVNAVAAKSVTWPTGIALGAGSIVSGQQYVVIYNATADRLELQPSTLGTQTISMPALAMRPRASNGCASVATVEISAAQPNVVSLDFDASAIEYAQLNIPMPKGWNEGTIAVQFGWSHAATTTNFAVVWAAQAVAIGDDDAQGVSFGTAVTVTDTGGTTNDLYISSYTSAITIAGTPAEGDMVCIQVYRDATSGSDTLAVDARLQWIRILFTLDAPTDA